MAELLAIGQDLKNLSTVSSLNSDGSVNLKFTGNAKYKPELRLTSSEVKSLVKAWSQPSSPPVIAPVSPVTDNSLIVAVDTSAWPVNSGLFSDLNSGGIKNVRVNVTNINFAKEVNSKEINIATIIFGQGGTIGSINKQQYATELVNYAKTNPSVKRFEVLNEPGGSWFWSDPTNYSGYTALLKEVHEAFNSELSSENRPKILASWDGGSVESPPGRFGPGVKKAGGYAYCDEVTVHPYGGATGAQGGAAGNRAMIENAHKETSLPVSITELGWPTGKGNGAAAEKPTGDSQQWTEQQQAENISNFISWCKAQTYIPLCVIFNAVGYGPNVEYGVEKQNRAHKLSFKVVADNS